MHHRRAIAVAAEIGGAFEFARLVLVLVLHPPQGRRCPGRGAYRCDSVAGAGPGAFSRAQVAGGPETRSVSGSALGDRKSPFRLPRRTRDSLRLTKARIGIASLPVCAVSSLRCLPRIMFESLNDPVDVLTAFVDGSMRPIRFRWQGRVVRVRKVTGQWARREGQAQLRYFAVQGAKDDSYELCFDARGPSWVLSRAWTGPG